MIKLSIKSEMIAGTIAEEIIRGEHAPGARLAQDAIASRFQCSHVPVREALQRLIQMELATSEPRKGVRVVALTSLDHVEIQEMRLVLEPLALRLAVAEIQGKDLKEIEEHRLSCDGAVDAIPWESANRAFHMAILKPCGRHRLLGQIENCNVYRRIIFIPNGNKNGLNPLIATMQASFAQCVLGMLRRHVRSWCGICDAPNRKGIDFTIDKIGVDYFSNPFLSIKGQPCLKHSPSDNSARLEMLPKLRSPLGSSPCLQKSLFLSGLFR